MNSKFRTHAATAGLIGTGLVAGAILAGSLTANAASTATTPVAAASAAPAPPTGQAPPTNPNPGDPSKPQRSDETLLTGDTAAQVKAAVVAKYPNATFTRIETDSDGVYEAHIVDGGNPLTVEVDKSFAVTGTEAMGGHR